MSLQTSNMGAQVGVGRVELAQLTAVDGVMMRRRGRRRSSTEMMTTLGTAPASPLTAAGVRGSSPLQVCLQLTDLVLETPVVLGELVLGWVTAVLVVTASQGGL